MKVDRDPIYLAMRDQRNAALEEARRYREALERIRNHVFCITDDEKVDRQLVCDGRNCLKDMARSALSGKRDD